MSTPAFTDPTSTDATSSDPASSDPTLGPISVVIADDQWMVREGLASLADLDDGVKVVGTASDGAEAIQLVERLRPRVVLMDIRMPVMDGIAATAHITARFPGTHVLMLTTFVEQALVDEAIAAGAIGYLTKDIAAKDLAQAVRAADAGIMQLSPSAAARLFTAPLSPSPTSAAMPNTGTSTSTTALAELSNREREVLLLVAEGYTNREIGQRLHLSSGTVKNHVSSILRRLNLTDRTQAAVLAAQHGLLGGTR